jgi:hypothetical protein
VVSDAERGSGNGRRAGVALQPPRPSRTEVQLRARVAELEARLADVTRCLESAENRAAELLAMREQVVSVQADAERRLAELANSNSWRMTKPLRSARAWIRRVFGR